MNKIKTLKWVVALLLILNLGLLTILVKGHKKGPPPTKHIKNQFEWSDEQYEEFEKSKSLHMENSKRLNSKLMEYTTAYYISSDHVTKDSLLNNIVVVNNEIYETNDSHISDIRKLTRPDQKQKLEDFIVNLLSPRRRGHKDRKKRPHKGK